MTKPDPRPRGVYCPNCRGVRLTVYKLVRPVAGRTVRYRECSACGLRVVTSETVARSLPRPPAGKG